MRVQNGKPSPPTRPSLRPERVCAELAHEIVSGRYAAGMLPTEAELSRRFATSRATVREAVKLLKGKGMVDPRPNLGTRIRPRSEWNMLDTDVLAWRLVAQPPSAFAAQVGEIRRLIEPAAAEMAARRATDVDIVAVAEAYAAMEAVGSDRTAFSEADLRFHQAILAASGNELMAAFGALVRTALTLSFELSSRSPQAPRGALPSHRRVLDAVASRDGDAARDAMIALLDRTENNIRTTLAVSRDPV